MVHFVEVADFTTEDLSKGQAMQLLLAMWKIGCAENMAETGVTIDDVIDKIIHEKMWFNPHLKRTGVGGIHSCEARQGYKRGGVTVMDMSEEDQRKDIRAVLMSKVLNTKTYHYLLKPTAKDPGRANRWSRNADNSVFAHAASGRLGYCEMHNGNIRFTKKFLRRFE